MLAGAQVFKTQDATLIPGGIAATIDIRTISRSTTTARLSPYAPARRSMKRPTTCRTTTGLAIAAAPALYAYQRHPGCVTRCQYPARKNGFPDARTFGWNTPDNSGGSTGDLNGDGVLDNTTWGLVTEVKEVTQDRGAVSGSIRLARERQSDDQGGRPAGRSTKSRKTSSRPGMATTSRATGRTATPPFTTRQGIPTRSSTDRWSRPTSMARSRTTKAPSTTTTRNTRCW